MGDEERKKYENVCESPFLLACGPHGFLPLFFFFFISLSFSNDTMWSTSPSLRMWLTRESLGFRCFPSKSQRKGKIVNLSIGFFWPRLMGFNSAHRGKWEAGPSYCEAPEEEAHAGVNPRLEAVQRQAGKPQGDTWDASDMFVSSLLWFGVAKPLRCCCCCCASCSFWVSQLTDPCRCN